MTPNTAPTLLGCPFCGNPPAFDTSSDSGVIIKCNTFMCAAETLELFSWDAEEAVRMWNTRAPTLPKDDGAKPVAWRFRARIGNEDWIVGNRKPPIEDWDVIEPLFAAAQIPSREDVLLHALRSIATYGDLDIDAEREVGLREIISGIVVCARGALLRSQQGGGNE